MFIYEYFKFAVDIEKSLTCFLSFMSLHGGFLGGSDGKESACRVGDRGVIPGLGRSPGEENATYSLAWRILQIEEPGGLQSMRMQRVGHN